jgi:hypothetical protein
MHFNLCKKKSLHTQSIGEYADGHHIAKQNSNMIRMEGATARAPQGQRGLTMVEDQR